MLPHCRKPTKRAVRNTQFLGLILKDGFQRGSSIVVWLDGSGWKPCRSATVASSTCYGQLVVLCTGLRYLAIVIESEDAHQTSKIIELLEWLIAIGVKHVCLYDAEGILKKSKESILAKLDCATLLEESHEDDVLLNQKDFTLEFASFTDGKEAVAKAANVLFMKYLKLSASGRTQEDQIFTEPNMTEALKAVGCIGLEPDLLLVYGPARCHLGFPAWRIRYTEIVHMGPLKSMRYGSLRKAIHKFTMVRQNYGK
ncbi:hypothetical protein SLE2022_155910 [Rubroshorea leprosula]